MTLSRVLKVATGAWGISILNSLLPLISLPNVDKLGTTLNPVYLQPRAIVD